MDATARYCLATLCRTLVGNFILLEKSPQKLLLPLWPSCAGDICRDLDFGSLLRLLGAGILEGIEILDFRHHTAAEQVERAENILGSWNLGIGEMMVEREHMGITGLQWLCVKFIRILENG